MIRPRCWYERETPAIDGDLWGRSILTESLHRAWSSLVPEEKTLNLVPARCRTCCKRILLDPPIIPSNAAPSCEGPATGCQAFHWRFKSAQSKDAFPLVKELGLKTVDQHVWSPTRRPLNPSNPAVRGPPANGPKSELQSLSLTEGDARG